MTRTSRQIAAIWLLLAYLAPGARPGEIALETDEAAHPCVIQGARTLAGALGQAGHETRLVAPSTSDAPLTIVVGVVGDLHLEGLLDGLEEEPGTDGFYLATEGDDLLVVAGGGTPGALYGCLALAGLAASGQLVSGKSFAPVRVTESPAFATRALLASLRAPGGGDRPLREASEAWFYDPTFWEDFTGRMALWRFDTLVLDLADPLAAFGVPPASPAGGARQGPPLSPEEAEANREALTAACQACDRHGVRLLLGIDADRMPGDATATRAALAGALGDLIGIEEGFGLRVARGSTGDTDRFVGFVRDVIIPLLSPHAESTSLALSIDEESWGRLGDLLDASDLEVMTSSPYNGELLASDRVIEAATARLARRLSHHVVQVGTRNLTPLRCCAPLFVGGCARTMREAGAEGLLITPLAPGSFPYAADRVDPPLLATERDWIWYESWSRYAWDADRPDAQEKSYWEDRLGRRYGDIKAGRSLYAALDAGSRILPRISRSLAPSHRPAASPLLGATLEQLMVDATRRFNPVDGETPRSSILRQRRGEPVTGETFFGVLDDIVSMSNTVWDKVAEAGQWVHSNREAFSRLAGDLVLARQTGLVWCDRALAAYDATAFCLQGGSNHRQAVAKHLGSAVDDFSDLATLLGANYQEPARIFGPRAWPRPVSRDALRIDALGEDYRLERERVEENMARLDDPETPRDLARAIRLKPYVEVESLLAAVPGSGGGPRQGTWLILDAGLEPGPESPSGGTTLEITASVDGQDRQLLRTRVTRSDWTTHVIPLDAVAGRRCRLRLRLEGIDGPIDSAALIAAPRVVTGRLPARIASWALPSTATVCASLLEPLAAGMAPAEGFSVERGWWAAGRDSRDAVRIGATDRSSREGIAADLMVSIPPAAGPPAWPEGGILGLDHLEIGPGGKRAARQGAAAPERVILRGTPEAPSWVATPRLAPPAGAEPAGWRLVADVTLEVDASRGAVTAIGIGGEADLIGAPLGPAFELVAIGHGLSARPEWRSRWTAPGANHGGPDAAEAGEKGQNVPRIGGAGDPITGASLAEGDRQRVLLVRLPEGGVAAWILDADATPGALPTVLETRARIPDGSRYYLRHTGAGSAALLSATVSARAEPMTVPPPPAAAWPPDLSRLLAPWSRRAAESAAAGADRPLLTAPWLESARQERQRLARVLLPWQAGDGNPGPRPEETGVTVRRIHQTDDLSIDHVEIRTGPQSVVPGHLYRPRPAPGPLPLVIVLPPIPGAGKAGPATVWPAIELARHGMAVLTYDAAGQGERSDQPASARPLAPAGISATGLGLAELRAVAATISGEDGFSGQIALLGLGPARGRLALWAAAIDPSIVAVATDAPIEPLGARFDRLLARTGLGPIDERETAGWVETTAPLARTIGLLAPRPVLLLTAPETPADPAAGGARPTIPLADQLRPYWHLFGRDADLVLVKQTSSSVDFRSDLLRRIATFYRTAFGLEDTAPLAARIPNQVPAWHAVMDALRGPTGGSPSSPIETGAAATGLPAADRELARRAVADRPPRAQTVEEAAYAAEVRDRLRAALGPAGDPGEIEATPIPGWIESLGGHSAAGWSLQSDAVFPLLIVLVRPDGIDRPPVALAASGRGLAAAALLPDVTELLDKGIAVCLVELTGQGNRIDPADLAILAGGASTTLLRRWADDLHAVVNHLATRADISLDRPLIVGEGAAGVAALVAAVEDERLGGLIARETICSFADLIEAGASGPASEAAHPALCVPGILSLLDIDQLICALGRRPVLFVDPVDGRRRALSKDRLDRFLSAVREHDWTSLEVGGSRR